MCDHSCPREQKRGNVRAQHQPRTHAGDPWAAVPPWEKAPLAGQLASTGHIPPASAQQGALEGVSKLQQLAVHTVLFPG